MKLVAKMIKGQENKKAWTHVQHGGRQILKGRDKQLLVSTLHRPPFRIEVHTHINIDNYIRPMHSLFFSKMCYNELQEKKGLDLVEETCA